MANKSMNARINVEFNEASSMEELRSGESVNTLFGKIKKWLNGLKSSIDDIKLFKFPNVIIHGDPTVNNGQISNFSSSNYLMLPFVFNFEGKAFELSMAFTTGSNVTNAQNLFGSNYCMAAYIANGHLIFKVSSNGTSYNAVDYTTKVAIEANKTYYFKFIFDRLNYKIQYSLNGTDYILDGTVVSTLEPHPGQIYIGIGNGFNNPFGGIINFNKCELKINNSIYWEGMDDVGLATRMATDMDNIDEAGIQKVKDIASEIIPESLPANGGNSATVNGHTVNADVPADAKFTDTIYDDAEIKSQIDGKTPILLTDTEEAYSKETVFPYAAVNSIGGKSVVWNQIAKNTPFSSRSGITVSTDGNYSVYSGTANNTNGAYGWYGLATIDGVNIVGHKVLAHAKIISGQYNGVAKFGVSNQAVDIGEMMIAGITSDSYSASGNLSSFAWGTGTTFDNLKLHIIFVDLTAMFGAGNEPITTSDPRIAWIEAYAEAHPEYNAGEIISAEVGQVVTRGKNLWDEEWEIGAISSENGSNVSNSSRIRSKNYIEIESNMPYYYGLPSEHQYIWIFYYDSNYNFILFTSGEKNKSYASPTEARYVRFIAAATNYNGGIIIAQGSTPTEYKPYIKPQIYEISEAIKQLDGYGWSAGEVYNEVDYANRKYSRKTAKYVFTGTEEWAAYGNGWRSVCLAEKAINYAGSDSNIAVIASNGYIGNSRDNISSGATNSIALTVNTVIVSDKDSFAAGTTIYYRLAETTITDISNIITDDFLIECEAGGTVEFENESKLSVPNEVEYITEADFARRAANKIDVLSDILILTADGWTDNRQTLIFQHDTAKLNTIIVEPESLADYGAAVIYPISETYSGIVFRCANAPTADIKIRIKSEVVRNA